MRHAFLMLVLAAMLCACAASLPDPALVTSWKPLGVSCTQPVVGMPDNIPQWTCRATIRDVAVGISVSADDVGVVEIDAQVPSDTDPATARAVFDDLVSNMDAFPDARTRLVSWIDGWGGGRGQVSTEFATGRATIASDSTWIGLYMARVPG